ncbi:MAG: hypothetical protein JNM84_15415 [Planctomycetes bacterium]|nr:hypothetical protein [Planctomycetota bacterium]
MSTSLRGAPRVCLALGAAYLAAGPALAQTWIVDAAGAPGSHFRTIQAAVDAAADGDTILLRSGSYGEAVSIDGKALHVVGLGGCFVFASTSRPTPAPLFEVKNLPAGREVHLRGFDLARLSGQPGDALHLRGNAGRVWCEELFLDTYDGPALHIEDCAEVLLSDVFAQANLATLDVAGRAIPAAGMVIERCAHVSVFGGQARGSHGPPLFRTPTQPIAGGAGVAVRDARVSLVGITLEGGTGGSFEVSGCLLGARGGSALLVAPPTTSAREVLVHGASLRAGSSGFRDRGCAPDPGNAPEIDDPSAAVRSLSGAPARLEWPTLPYPSGNFEFQIVGAPQELFLGLLSLETQDGAPMPGIEGELFLPLAASIVGFAGRLDAAGFHQRGAGFVSPGGPVHLHAQVVLLDARGTLRFTGPGTLLLR